AKGEVIIGKGSKVVGSVSGGSVIVSGTVEGNITAAQSLEIAKSGRVHGDLSGGRIIIEEGSSYRGKVRVESGKDEKTAAAQAEEGVIEEESQETVAPEEITQAQMF
ncbi:MAG: polymer-forming cytoskeletal protein, partial [Candidatus Margulisiibacteriota bacterium]